jgi:hypothetical protein
LCIWSKGQLTQVEKEKEYSQTMTSAYYILFSKLQDCEIIKRKALFIPKLQTIKTKYLTDH